MEVMKPEVNYLFGGLNLLQISYWQKSILVECWDVKYRRFCFFFNLLQQYTVNIPDYEMLQDIDTEVEVAQNANGKINFNRLKVFSNNCLKADYATLAEAFFHIFVNVTKAHIM